MVSLFLLSCLAACDKEPVEVVEQGKEEPKENEKIQKEGNIKNTKIPPSSYDEVHAAKYYISGLWMSDTSYIQINKGNPELGVDASLKNFVKKYEKKEIIRFRMEESLSPIKLTAIITDSQVTNKHSYFFAEKNSFFTLELNEEQTELTIKMPNEKKVTYKKATMEPQEFNPDFANFSD